jgi:hypothetical protein
MNYRFMGKQKTLALGVYPAVSLAAARKGRDKAREWMSTTANQRSSETHKRVVSWFERDVFPRIGQRPINSLRLPDILDMMKKMPARREMMQRWADYLNNLRNEQTALPTLPRR